MPATMTEARDAAMGRHPQGATTRAIEEYTSRVPSGTYLSLAIGAIGLSAGPRLVGRKDDAQFVGQWAPTILLLGVYNKMVKQHGSD